MNSQLPAEGILKTHDFGDSMWYYIRCECGDDLHAHSLEIEADDFMIQVHTHLSVHTHWWEKNRWKQIWQILTTGVAEMQSTIVMKEQTAINYAAALNSAVNDVSNFKIAEKLKLTKQ